MLPSGFHLLLQHRAGAAQGTVRARVRSGDIPARRAEVGEGFRHKEHFQGQMQNSLVNTENILNRSECVKEIL